MPTKILAACALMLVSLSVNGAAKKRQQQRCRMAAVSRAGIKSCGNACAAGRTLVEDRERGVVAGDPRARVVIANRDRR